MNAPVVFSISSSPVFSLLALSSFSYNPRPACCQWVNREGNDFEILPLRSGRAPVIYCKERGVDTFVSAMFSDLLGERTSRVIFESASFTYSNKCGMGGLP